MMMLMMFNTFYKCATIIKYEFEYVKGNFTSRLLWWFKLFIVHNIVENHKILL